MMVLTDILARLEFGVLLAREHTECVGTEVVTLYSRSIDHKIHLLSAVLT